MKRVTLSDVATAAGVSRSLASLAYRGEEGVGDATRARILMVGDRLGYSPNRAAAQLASGRGDSIGFFVQDQRNDFFADVHEGLRDVAEATGRHLVLSVGTIDGGRDADGVRALEQSRVDLVVAVGLQLSDIAVSAFAGRLPVVTVARRVEGLDAAESNNREGAAAAIAHLVALGHRDIVFLANPPSDGYHDRNLGYVDSMRRAGLVPRSIETTYARPDSAEVAGDVLDGASPPTALFAHNDVAALGVLDALSDRGLRPGVDVAVVGYDNSSASRLPGAGLTTVDIGGKELGRLAGELALRRIENPGAAPEVRTTEPRLIVRSTSGPPLGRPLE
jgi:DNA-binding LacI/PurR family transcriptional regulator